MLEVYVESVVTDQITTRKGRGRYAAVAITDKTSMGMCNLRCRYCFYYDVTQNREQENYGLMSRDTLENLVKKSVVYAVGNCGFAFQGGEPTLVGLDFYKDLIQFVSSTIRRRFRFRFLFRLMDTAWKRNGLNFLQT